MHGRAFFVSCSIIVNVIIAISFLKGVPSEIVEVLRYHASRLLKHKKYKKAGKAARK